MERTIFTNRWYALKPSKLVKKAPCSVNMLGKDLVLWRNRDDQVVVQGDICPHRGAKLSLGKLKKNGTSKCIVCPYHGWQFDSEGTLVQLPAESDSQLLNKVKIDTVHSMESGGLVWACFGTPLSPSPPVVPEMNNRDWISVTGQETFEADWVTSLENSIDLAHVNFVHSDFGDPQNGHVDVEKIKEVSSDHFVMKSTIHHKSDSILLRFTDNPSVKVTHDVLLPNTISIKFWVRDIMQVITYVTYTPIKGNKTLINWVFLRKPRIPIADAILNRSFVNGMNKAIREDKLIVESLECPPHRINIDIDNIQVKFRKQLVTLSHSEPTSMFID